MALNYQPGYRGQGNTYRELLNLIYMASLEQGNYVRVCRNRTYEIDLAKQLVLGVWSSNKVRINKSTIHFVGMDEFQSNYSRWRGGFKINVDHAVMLDSQVQDFVTLVNNGV